MFKKLKIVGGILVSFAAILFLNGCATTAQKPIEMALDYPFVQDQTLQMNLQGYTVTIVPFVDMRTDKTVYPNIVMREGDDSGIWVANALKVELEHLGCKVDTLSAGDRPVSGSYVTGRVNVMKATSTGWQGGGLFSALSGAGASAHIDVNVDFVREGITIFVKQYEIKKRVVGNTFAAVMVGPDTANDVKKAFQIALRELVRTKIIPDIDSAFKEAKQ